MRQVFFILVCLLALAIPAVGAAPTGPSRILVLKTYPASHPIPDTIDRGLRKAIIQAGLSVDDLLIENLDLARFSGAEYRDSLVRLLRHKLTGQKIDIVILEGPPAVELAIRYLDDLFPEVPFLTLIVPDISPLKGDRHPVLNIPWRVDPAGTLRAALKLFPDTRRVLVITGAREGVLPFIEEAKRAFAPWRDKLKFEYTNRLTYHQILERVSSLPAGSIAIYSPLFNDATGQNFVPAEVVAEICRISPVPVFATLGYYLGSGIVGGSLLQTEEIGRKAGQLAVAALKGRLSLTGPLTNFEVPTRLMFDWQQLHRWKVDLDRLPRGSVVINRPASIWRDYQGYVFGVLALVLLQAGFIAALLILSRRKKSEAGKRREAEAALRQSEEKFRLVVERANEGIAVIQDGKYRFVNDCLLDILKMTREEVLASEVMFMVHPEDRALLLERVTNRLAGRPVEEMIEHRIINSRGEVRWLETRGVLSNWEGKPASIAFASDITERKQALEAVKVSEEKFRDLVQNARSLIVQLDAAGRITFINEFAQTFFGFSEGELLNKKLVGTLVPETESSGRDLSNLISQLLESPDNFLTNENENLRADGSRVWMAWGNRPIYDDEGRLTGILCIGNDITERKKAEEKAKQLEIQLRQAQKMEAVGTLAGGIAHDFNNILAAIIGFADLSLEDLPPDDPELRSNLDRIRNSALRARDLVRQILSFSRQDERVKIPIRLELIVEETIRMLRATLPAGIEIQRRFEPELSLVEADPTQMQQLILNLGSNAADVLKKSGGVIEVTLENTKVDRARAETVPGLPEGDYVTITFRDNGPGIGPGIADRIFDPFFTTKGLGSGTGMGLSVVHGIVQGHEGAIEVQSTPGRGTSFVVYLPASDTRQPQPEKQEPETIPRGWGRVLFVDDEQPVADFAERMLTRLGYEPVIRTASPEALAVFEADPDSFRLVVTDMTMPQMTGADLAGKIRAIRPDIPILLCTGYSDQIDEQKARRLGINRLVLKPLSLSEMGQVIREVLESAV